MKNKALLLFFLISVLASCDCLQHVQGYVFDAETQLPIDSVLIVNNNLSDSLSNNGLGIYTDSLGRFDYTSLSIGLFGCPKISLSFIKEGYDTTNNKYKSCCTDEVTVNLKQAINKNISFDNKINIPNIKNCKGAEKINNYLKNHIITFFYLEDTLDIESILFQAKIKGLDSLGYDIYMGDSTISFVYHLKVQRGIQRLSHREYMTFSSISGKRLSLNSLFPKWKNSDLQSIIEEYEHNFIEEKRNEIKELNKLGF
jgi:hypothetical protein